MDIFCDKGPLPQRRCDVTTEIDAVLLEAWRASAGDPDSQVASWCLAGSPAGIVDQYPTCGIFPEVTKPSDPRALTRFDDDFTNYSTVEDDPAAAAEVDKRFRL